MVEVFKNIFIGTDKECSFNSSSDFAIIHACKYPCHAGAVGYRGSLQSNHPYYLILENGQNLFLNMVDMEKELSPIYTHPIMKTAIAFIEKHVGERKILVHCNQGMSRSPSIALLYLARIGVIPNDSYSNAVISFQRIYPYFNPGRGIALYMNNNWAELIRM
jgi:hypothetical protein